MIFKLFGLVKWRGKKIANGIDGRFETNDERVINILKQKGFEEITPKDAGSSLGKPKKLKNEPRARKKVSARSRKNS